MKSTYKLFFVSVLVTCSLSTAFALTKDRSDNGGLSASPQSAVANIIDVIGANAGGSCSLEKHEADKDTYYCGVFSVKPESFTVTVRPRRTSAVNGMLLEVSEVFGWQLDEGERQRVMLEIGEDALQYFQSIDNSATWDRQILKRSTVFNDPNALSTFFTQGDQSSAAFVEMSTHGPIRIFIGFAG